MARGTSGAKGGPRQPDMTRGGRSQTKGGGTGPSGRGLKERVKTANKRSASSTRWLDRQLNDPYVAEAKKRGFRSRAASKLLQLDERFHFLKSGARVVDLGEAPGGWTQVAGENSAITCVSGGSRISSRSSAPRALASSST